MTGHTGLDDGSVMKLDTSQVVHRFLPWLVGLDTQLQSSAAIAFQLGHRRGYQLGFVEGAESRDEATYVTGFEDGYIEGRGRA